MEGMRWHTRRNMSVRRRDTQGRTAGWERIKCVYPHVVMRGRAALCRYDERGAHYAPHTSTELLCPSSSSISRAFSRARSPRLCPSDINCCTMPNASVASLAS